MHTSGASPLLLPRHREAASRTIAYFLLAGGPVIAVCALLVPAFAGPTAVGRWSTVAVGVAMLVCGAAARRVPERFPEAFWAAMPFLAIAVVTALDLLTYDSSVGAHLYFLWPTLYAALYLRRNGVLLVLAAVSTGDALVVFALTPPARAFTDLVALITSLTLAALVIMRLREGSDRLLDTLEVQALSDPLTGLGNRRAFTRDIERAVEQHRRTGTPVSLISVDVDRFKQINDRYGHPAGDEILQAVAEALGAATRRSDIVARLGGDEFVALLEAGPDHGYRVAEAVRAAIARRADLPGGPPTLSVGVASMPADADTVEGLLAASDAALYAAKVAGRDRTATAPGPLPPRDALPPESLPHDLGVR